MATTLNLDVGRGQRTQYSCGFREDDARKPAWMLDVETSKIAPKARAPYSTTKATSRPSNMAMFINARMFDNMGMFGLERACQLIFTIAGGWT